MKIYSKNNKLGLHRTESFERMHLIEIVKAFSSTIGEVNEIIAGRWSYGGDSTLGLQQPSPSEAISLKKTEIMNYLIESAVSYQIGGCPLQMTRIKDQDFLVEMIYPEPAQANNLSLGEEAKCPKLLLSSSTSAKELYEIPMCQLPLK